MATFKIYTLGCKVNQYDSQGIRENLSSRGFKEIYNGRKADIYIINTCTVTQRADSESLNFIRRAKRENPSAKIVITGCLTELDSQRISREEGVSLIVKNKDKNRILGLITSYTEHQSPKTENRTPNTEHRGISYFSGRTRAFLKIQDGCDNFCSYCKVPLVRGRSRSKPLKEIMLEAQGLVENGFKEVVLTGICLGAYIFPHPALSQRERVKAIFSPLVGEGKGEGRKKLVDILDALEDIEGLLRLRLSSIEAGDVSDELIEKMAESKLLCRHLHIPIQSGDNEILARMNRRYSREEYLILIKKIKRRIPGIAITTDVIAGFPGESDNDFLNTLELVRQIQPLKVHIFSYSRRDGTPAAEFDGKIAPVVIKQRIQQLKSIADTCALAYKKRFLNKTVDVLIEGRCRKYKGCWEGFTGNYIKVLVESDKDLKNRLITVKTKRIERDFMVGAHPSAIRRKSVF